MKKIKFSLIILFLSSLLFSCKENSVNQNTETLIYQLDGIIENIGGDCSAVQVRTRNLGAIDLTGSDKIKFQFSGSSDADLSSISIYYFENDEQIYLVNLVNRDEINNTGSIEIDSPSLNTDIYTRATLKSSVCTGQIYFLTFRDLKIYSISQ